MNAIESAATIFSDEELDLIKSDPYQVIINKLQELKDNNNPWFKQEVESFAHRIAGIDYNHSENRMKGVRYDAKKDRYIAEKWHDGKVKSILTTNNRQKAIDAYVDFCTKNGYKI